MEKIKVSGDFDVALSNLLMKLVGNREVGSLEAVRLLAAWDADRGTDWYTSTLKRDLK